MFPSTAPSYLDLGRACVVNPLLPSHLSSHLACVCACTCGCVQVVCTLVFQLQVSRTQRLRVTSPLPLCVCVCVCVCVCACIGVCTLAYQLQVSRTQCHRVTTALGYSSRIGRGHFHSELDSHWIREPLGGEKNGLEGENEEEKWRLIPVIPNYSASGDQEDWGLRSACAKS
jgi:hypothetical protein